MIGFDRNWIIRFESTRKSIQFNANCDPIQIIHASARSHQAVWNRMGSGCIRILNEQFTRFNTQLGSSIGIGIINYLVIIFCTREWNGALSTPIAQFTCTHSRLKSLVEYYSHERLLILVGSNITQFTIIIAFNSREFTRFYSYY